MYCHCSYYTLMMWFPELFNRFETFEHQQPGQDVSVCQVSSVYVEKKGELNPADLCGSSVGQSVYTHTLWIGIACIPTSLWMPLCVHRLGAKFFLGIENFYIIYEYFYVALYLHHWNFIIIESLWFPHDNSRSLDE